MSELKLMPLYPELGVLFGFKINDSGAILDKKKVFCRTCKNQIAYSGNTSNLLTSNLLLAEMCCRGDRL